MRALYLVTALALSAFSAAAVAQSATDGPLVVPDPLPRPAPVARPAKAKMAHHKSSRSARRAPAAADSAGFAPSVPAEAQPAAHASGDQLPSDPLTFGMKWNGSNDNAAQTRAQNYDGSAPGTGAEVGMKLHF